MRIVLAVLFVLAGVARADVHTSKAGKVSIDIPKKWSVTETDELIRAASPDSQVAFVFWVIDSAELKPALTKLEGELYSSVQGLRWIDKVEKVKLNSLPASVVQGVGVNSAANQLDLLVTVAGPTKTKKGVILLAVVEHDKLEANRKMIQRMFQTLKPTK